MLQIFAVIGFRVNCFRSSNNEAKINKRQIWRIGEALQWNDSKVFQFMIKISSKSQSISTFRKLNGTLSIQKILFPFCFLAFIGIIIGHWLFTTNTTFKNFHFIVPVHSPGIWSFPITNSQSDDSVYKLAVSFYRRNVFTNVLLCVQIFLSLSLYSIVLPTKLLSRSRCFFKHANCFIFSVLILMFSVFLANVAQNRTFCSANCSSTNVEF